MTNLFDINFIFENQDPSLKTKTEIEAKLFIVWKQ